MIPMVDPAAWHQDIQTELESAAIGVLRSGRFVQGPNVQGFEDEVAAYLECKHAISCANGTDALVLALRAAGIGSGDEVITTAFTFFATAEAIMQVGAKPVFVDIEPETFNLNPSCLETALSPATRAVLLVHLFGLPANVRAVRAFCHKHDLLLIEDCAQSFGARVDAQQTGTFGQLGCYSFFPSKNLGGFGDGGLVVTDDDEMAIQLKQLRNHGSREQYLHDQIGYNSRLDELQAALLRVKLRHIEHYNRQRQQVAHWYEKYLADIACCLPEGEGHIYHQYTMLIGNREAVKNHLLQQNIASAVYYPLPLHQQNALNGRFWANNLAVTEQVCNRCLSLPVFPGMTEHQVEAVAGGLLSFRLAHAAE